jgi:hypothetical protein
MTPTPGAAFPLELSVDAGGLVVLPVVGLLVGGLLVENEVLHVVRDDVLGLMPAVLTPPEVPHPNEIMCGSSQV